MKTLTIEGTMPGLNEYIAAIAGNRYMGGKMKREQTERVAWACKAQGFRKMATPPEIVFFWYEKNRKRDKDNVAFAKKFILDGLVMAGVLDGDGWKGYGDFDDRFEVDSKNPRVEVLL